MLLDIATTICIGLLIGTEFAVSAFVNPVVYRLEDHAQTQAIRMFAARLGAAMPFWYGGCLVLLVLETVIHGHTTGEWLLLAAAAIWLTVIALTIGFLVPINNRMARMAADLPVAQWLHEHRRWDTLHRLRVAALLVAMISFLLARHS